MDDYIELKAAVAAIQKRKQLTYKDIGKLTGYSPDTISTFMCKKTKRMDSENVARAIAKALDIPEHMAT